MKLEITFTSMKNLKAFLKEKQWDFDSPEEFHKWLSDFYEEGNSITVLGKEIDYHYCTEII